MDQFYEFYHVIFWLQVGSYSYYNTEIIFTNEFAPDISRIRSVLDYTVEVVELSPAFRFMTFNTHGKGNYIIHNIFCNFKGFSTILLNHWRQLLCNWIWNDFKPEGVTLHHHLVSPLRHDSDGLLDKFPDPPWCGSWAHGAPHHCAPGPRQHLQHHQHQYAESRKINSNWNLHHCLYLFCICCFNRWTKSDKQNKLTIINYARVCGYFDSNIPEAITWEPNSNKSSL